MGKIRVLPERLVSKIAAGEVVQRPASVVKELVENSVDANPTFIKIKAERGGMKKILVADNGEGMDKKDVLQCFKPHSTSKLLKEEDLVSIKSMGFRGEALCSIASVSNVIIKSRVKKENAGTVIEVLSGVMKRSAPVGVPVGTSVIVTDLFHSVPARRNFLKVPKTEFKYITDVVIDLALANPRIGFILSHDERIVLDLPEDQSLTERVKEIFGSDVFVDFLLVSYKKAYFKVFGFIARPQVSARSRLKQHVFINKRPVTSRIISQAVEEAYGSLLQPRTYPVFVFHLGLPHAFVDVNVHPRKEQVSFSDDKFVYELVKSAVERTLEKADLIYKKRSKMESDVDYLFEGSKDWVLGENGDGYATFDSENILQVHNQYLVMENSNGLLLIDQHAAHERILYERLLEDIKEGTVGLAIKPPATFDLSISDYEALMGNLDIFNRLGFDIEEFGKRTLKVNSVPSFVEVKNAILYIKEVVSDLAAEKQPRKFDSETQKALSYMACRGAIKAGNALNLAERSKLLKDLSETKTHYTCPHGRPVKIEIGMKELNRMFKRG